MHQWGDENVDWKGISSAAYFVGENLRRYGRVQVTDIKEKYGTARVYCHFGWSRINDITHPGYIYCQHSNFVRELDRRCLRWMYRWVNYVVVPYQIWLYRYLYKQAIIKWPHLKEEILSGADYWRYLKDL